MSGMMTDEGLDRTIGDKRIAAVHHQGEQERDLAVLRRHQLVLQIRSSVRLEVTGTAEFAETGIMVTASVAIGVVNFVHNELVLVQSCGFMYRELAHT